MQRPSPRPAPPRSSKRKGKLVPGRPRVSPAPVVLAGGLPPIGGGQRAGCGGRLSGSFTRRVRGALLLLVCATGLLSVVGSFWHRAASHSAFDPVVGAIADIFSSAGVGGGTAGQSSTAAGRAAQLFGGAAGLMAVGNNDGGSSGGDDDVASLFADRSSSSSSSSSESKAKSKKGKGKKKGGSSDAEGGGSSGSGGGDAYDDERRAAGDDAARRLTSRMAQAAGVYDILCEAVVPPVAAVAAEGGGGGAQAAQARARFGATGAPSVATLGYGAFGGAHNYSFQASRDATATTAAIAAATTATTKSKKRAGGGGGGGATTSLPGTQYCCLTPRRTDIIKVKNAPKKLRDATSAAATALSMGTDGILAGSSSSSSSSSSGGSAFFEDGGSAFRHSRGLDEYEFGEVGASTTTTTTTTTTTRSGSAGTFDDGGSRFSGSTTASLSPYAASSSSPSSSSGGRITVTSSDGSQWTVPPAREWTWKCLPSFIVAGTQKSGSTALAAYLLAHPQVSMGRGKEIHFFDKEIQLGLLPYLVNFASAEGDNVVGVVDRAAIANFRRATGDALRHATATATAAAAAAATANAATTNDDSSSASSALFSASSAASPYSSFSFGGAGGGGGVGRGEDEGEGGRRNVLRQLRARVASGRLSSLTSLFAPANTAAQRRHPQHHSSSSSSSYLSPQDFPTLTTTTTGASALGGAVEAFEGPPGRRRLDDAAEGGEDRAEQREGGFKRSSSIFDRLGPLPPLPPTMTTISADPGYYDLDATTTAAAASSSSSSALVPPPLPYAPPFVNGEATPFYVADRGACAKIAEEMPEVPKLVVLVRDPVDRAYVGFSLLPGESTPLLFLSFLIFCTVSVSSYCHILLFPSS